LLEFSCYGAQLKLQHNATGTDRVRPVNWKLAPPLPRNVNTLLSKTVSVPRARSRDLLWFPALEALSRELVRSSDHEALFKDPEQSSSPAPYPTKRSKNSAPATQHRVDCESGQTPKCINECLTATAFRLAQSGPRRPHATVGIWRGKRVGCRCPSKAYPKRR
jgi:hypothetical protein